MESIVRPLEIRDQNLGGALQQPSSPDAWAGSSQDVTALLILTAVFLCCTALFFGILQLEIDIGRDFVVADMLLRGKALYHDVSYPFGPLAPWLHYLLLRLFGPSVSVILLAGTAGGLGVVLLTYLLAREVLPPTPALVAGLFVTVHAVYGPDIFSYATSYTLSATYGLLFSLLTLYAVLRSLDAVFSHWDLVAGAAGALALASKHEFAVISLATLASALTLRLLQARVRALPAATASIASYALVVALSAVLIFRRSTVGEFLGSVDPRPILAAYRYFYSIVGGWGAGFWSRTIKGVIRLASNFGFLLWATCALAAISAGIKDHLRTKVLVTVPLASLLLLWPSKPLNYFPFLLHAVVLGFALTGKVRGSPWKVGLLALCAAVFLLRVPGNPRSYEYGLLYFVPSLVAYLYLCYALAIPQLTRFLPEKQLQSAMTAVFILCFVAPELFSKWKWAQQCEAVRSERGVVRAGRDEAAKARVVLDEISRHSSSEESILMLPQGAMYYFLSNRRPASRHFDYTYGQIGDGLPERQEIEQLRQTPPRLVVLSDIPQNLFLSGPVNTFGDAYNGELREWIIENYEDERPRRLRNHLVHFLIPRQEPPSDLW